MAREKIIIFCMLTASAQNYYEPAINYESSLYIPAYGPSYGEQDYIFADYTFDELRNRCEDITYTSCQKLLREDLMKDYNKIFKPTEQPGKRIQIKVSPVLEQVLAVSQTDSTIELRMDLRQSWMEERLVWNKDEYNGSEYIHLSSGDLWNPEIVLYNNADGKFMPSLADTKARVDWSGEVTWNPLSIFKANCDLRVKQFPYDIQACTLMFKSWVYEEEELEIAYKDYAQENMAKIQSHIEWEVTGVKLWEETLEEWTQYGTKNTTYVCFTVFLSRLPLYYTLYIIVPTICVTGLVVFVFHSPSVGGEKVTLSISCLLTLTYFLTLVSYITPRSSYEVPIISKYLLFSMILVGMSTVTSVIVCNIHHRSPATHQFHGWIRHIFLNVLPRYLLIERPKKEKPTFPIGYRFSIDKDQIDLLTHAPKAASSAFNERTSRLPRPSIFGKKILTAQEIREISGSGAMRDSESDDEAISIIEDVARRVAEASEMMPRSAAHRGSTTSLTSGRQRRISRQSKIMAGISMERVIYSNRIIRMIADHEKEEDEESTQLDDWAFVALVIDRLLLILFGIVVLMGSFGIFYRFMFNFKSIEILHEEHFSRVKTPSL